MQPDNIILDVRMGEHFMGDEFKLPQAQPIRVKVRGTKPVAWVEVLKDGKVVYSTQPNARAGTSGCTRASDVLVTARVLRMGRNLVFGEVELFDEDGKMAVHATSTYALVS